MCTCYKLIKISKELRLHSRSVASAMHQLASKQRIRGMLGYLLRVAANQQRNQWSSSGGSTTLLVEVGRLCCTEHLTNALAAESVVKLFDENPLPRPPNAFPRRDGTEDSCCWKTGRPRCCSAAHTKGNKSAAVELSSFN